MSPPKKKGPNLSRVCVEREALSEIIQKRMQILQNVRKLTFKAPIPFILFSVKRNGRKLANAPFKKIIQHFALLPKLIREMPLF